jgi:hypothetical protein
MHTKVKRAAAVPTLDRLLDALADDLAEASEEEVLQACTDLRMDPRMRGSAAFIGLKGVSARLLQDFFDVDSIEALQQIVSARLPAAETGAEPPQEKPSRLPRLRPKVKDEEAGDK